MNVVGNKWRNTISLIAWDCEPEAGANGGWARTLQWVSVNERAIEWLDKLSMHLCLGNYAHEKAKWKVSTKGDLASGWSLNALMRLIFKKKKFKTLSITSAKIMGWPLETQTNKAYNRHFKNPTESSTKEETGDIVILALQIYYL